MKTVKPAGATPAWEQRKLTLHGSTAKRGMAKHGGMLRLLGEKPKGGKRP